VPGAALVVAKIVIVTEPSAGIEPFQVTVLVPVLTAARPEDAVALVSASCAGNTSVNSSPALSLCKPGPALVRTMV